MEKLEGTNTWADLLAAIGQGQNSAVMGGLTRVFVHELVNSYLDRPSTSSRCDAFMALPLSMHSLCLAPSSYLPIYHKVQSQDLTVSWHAVQVSCGRGGVCIISTAAPASDETKLFNEGTPSQPHTRVHDGSRKHACASCQLSCGCGRHCKAGACRDAARHRGLHQPSPQEGARRKQKCQ